MTPEQTAIARRLVAAPGWRWLPGIKCQWGRVIYSEGGALYVLDCSRKAAPVPEVGALPDLSDHLTVLGLLEVARPVVERAREKMEKAVASCLVKAVGRPLNEETEAAVVAAYRSGWWDTVIDRWMDAIRHVAHHQLEKVPADIAALLEAAP